MRKKLLQGIVLFLALITDGLASEEEFVSEGGDSRPIGLTAAVDLENILSKVKKKLEYIIGNLKKKYDISYNHTIQHMMQKEGESCEKLTCIADEKDNFLTYIQKNYGISKDQILKNLLTEFPLLSPENSLNNLIDEAGEGLLKHFEGLMAGEVRKLVDSLKDTEFTKEEYFRVAEKILKGKVEKIDFYAPFEGAIKEIRSQPQETRFELFLQCQSKYCREISKKYQDERGKILEDLQLLCPTYFNQNIVDELNSLLNKQEKVLLTKVHEMLADEISNF